MNTEKEPPSSYSTLLLEHREGIVRITLNRPEKLNALSTQLQHELARALDDVAQDATLRAVILTGSGRAFCAGLDLGEFPHSLTHFQNQPDRGTIFEKLDAVPAPVIGAINGPAVTGGFELALSCDLLLASRNAYFADTHGMLGVMPGAGLSQKLPRIIGIHRAMAISLTGAFFPAEEAYRCGLVSHLTEPEELLPEAWRLAEQIAKGDPAVIREMKRVIKEGLGMTLADGMALEREAHKTWANEAEMDGVMERRTALLHRRGGQPPDR